MSTADHRPRSSHPESAEELVADHLGSDEHVVAFAECLRKTKAQLFERASVVVTGRRLLVVGPAFPWGQEIKQQHPLESCYVVNGKERVDGSRLMVIRHDSGALCLYFSRHRRDEANSILDSVGLAPRQLEEAFPETPAVALPVDRMALTLELSALSELGDGGCEDD